MLDSMKSLSSRPMKSSSGSDRREVASFSRSVSLLSSLSEMGFEKETYEFSGMCFWRDAALIAVIIWRVMHIAAKEWKLAPLFGL